MQVSKADFVTSIADISNYAKFSGRPEIVIAGRSNVGKSSFINMLTNQKNLAKTSATPGRTRLVNLFDINGGQFYLVDLPGYGFAAAAKGMQEEWSGLIEQYLNASVNIAQVLVLVDIRRATALDKQMLKYLYARQLPFTVIATKCDKLSRSAVIKAVGEIAAELGVGKDNILPTSSEDRTGKEAVLQKIGFALEKEEQ